MFLRVEKFTLGIDFHICMEFMRISFYVIYIIYIIQMIAICVLSVVICVHVCSKKESLLVYTGYMYLIVSRIPFKIYISVTIFIFLILLSI